MKWESSGRKSKLVTLLTKGMRVSERVPLASISYGFVRQISRWSSIPDSGVTVESRLMRPEMSLFSYSYRAALMLESTWSLSMVLSRVWSLWSCSSMAERSFTWVVGSSEAKFDTTDLASERSY